MKSLYFALALAAVVSVADARKRFDDCCGPTNKVHESCYSDAQCPVNCIDSVPYRIKRSGHYIVKKCLSHDDKPAAICVEADNVTIEFCQGAVFTVGGSSTAIRIKGNNVNIINGVFKSESENAKAIELSKNIKGWTIADCIFKDFEEAIAASFFENGRLKNCDFFQCRIGFQQHGMESVAKRLTIENIRAEYVDMDEMPCPPPLNPDFTPNEENIAAINERLSWAISLNGEVVNSNITTLQLDGTTVYCFKCRDCLVDNIEINLPNVLCQPTLGLQCGAPRGAQLFNILLDPNDQTLKEGCLNCRLLNIRVRVVANPQLVNQLTFTAGIGAFFCSNCEITDSQAFMNTGKLAGAGIVESYCKNCVARRTQAEGPCLIGFHICDFLSIGEFCIGSIVEDAKSRNCLIGINNVRCHAPVIRTSSVQQNNIGINLSEGATNPIVENCYLSENCIGLYFGILEQNFGCFGPLSDPFCAAPCNGLAANNFFVGNTTTMLIGRDKNGNPLSLNTGNNTICTPTECNPGTNIFIDPVDTCSGMTPACNCVICTTSLICPAPGTNCPCSCPV